MIENQRITGRMGFRNRTNEVFHLSSIVLILILVGGLLSACAAPLPDSTPLPQPTLTNTLSALPTTPPTVTTTPAAETATLPIITSTIEPSVWDASRCASDDQRSNTRQPGWFILLDNYSGETASYSRLRRTFRRADRT